MHQPIHQPMHLPASAIRENGQHFADDPFANVLHASDGSQFLEVSPQASGIVTPGAPPAGHNLRNFANLVKQMKDSSGGGGSSARGRPANGNFQEGWLNALRQDLQVGMESSFKIELDLFRQDIE